MARFIVTDDEFSAMLARAVRGELPFENPELWLDPGPDGWWPPEYLHYDWYGTWPWEENVALWWARYWIKYDRFLAENFDRHQSVYHFIQVQKFNKMPR